MARRVFFSFHYQRDINRVNVVRNHDLTKRSVVQAGYIDHSMWESAQSYGDARLKTLISKELEGSSVTVVLSGAQTYLRPWVRYEVVRSLERGNGLMTIDVASVPSFGKIDQQGRNPLDYLYFRLQPRLGIAEIFEWQNGGWIAFQKLPSVPAASLGTQVRAIAEGQFSLAAAHYDWNANSGYQFFGQWVEQAAITAGRR